MLAIDKYMKTIIALILLFSPMVHAKQLTCQDLIRMTDELQRVDQRLLDTMLVAGDISDVGYSIATDILDGQVNAHKDDMNLLGCKND